MKRCIAALFVGVGLIAASCSSGPTGPLTYTAQADAPSPSGKILQFSAFFPGTIKARPGDTIVFDSKGASAPHSISFGINADRSNSPPTVVPGVGENPAVFFNCVTSQAPTPKLTKCPTKTGGAPPEFTGSGYWNAFLVPSTAPQGLKRVSLKLAASIKPGSYSFICILHAPMVGKVEVVSNDADRDTVTEFNEARDKEVSDAETRAANIPNPPVAGKTPATVAAGWSGGPIAVNQFYPKELTVKAGSRVSFEAFSPFEPHTVTFEAPKNASPGPFFAPSGTKSGGAYSGGPANSGIFGAKGGRFPAGPFVLSFPNAGTYKYVCVLHPGMEGTVKVT